MVHKIYELLDKLDKMYFFHLEYVTAIYYIMFDLTVLTKK